MEIEEGVQPQLGPHPPPHQHSTRVTTCARHPDVEVIGLCALCLNERLVHLDASRRSTGKNQPASPSSSTSTLLKSILFRPSSDNKHHQSLPSLRRCKSSTGFNANGPPRSLTFEPQRKSCDARGCNRSASIQEDEDRRDVARAFKAVDGPKYRGVDEEDHVIREQYEERTIREHIHLDISERERKNHNRKTKPPPKDLKEIAGSFWLAASVFSKKLQRWRHKQKLKKQNNKGEHHHHVHISCSSTSSSSSLSSLKRHRQAPHRSIELGNPPDDVFGRSSCDIVPRFSLDAGRMSLDDPRCSWEEPRASWDGCLVGGGGDGFNNNRYAFARPMAMASVVEGGSNSMVQRSDGLIPVEEEDLCVPGGSDDYEDYLQQSRRNGLDRSISKKIRDDEDPIKVSQPPPLANANRGGSGRVTFELGADESFHYSRTSLRDEWSDSFESCHRNPQMEGPPHQQNDKPHRQWTKAWNIWGFIQRRSNARGGKGVQRSMSETWPEREAGHISNGRWMLRSNSSISSGSWHCGDMGGRSGCMTRSNHNGLAHVDINGEQRNSNKKRSDGFTQERNRSGRYSNSPANNINSNGMLRFYLTPTRSGRRGGNKSVKEGFGNTNAFRRSMLQLH